MRPEHAHHDHVRSRNRKASQGYRFRTRQAHICQLQPILLLQCLQLENANSKPVCLGKAFPRFFGKHLLYSCALFRIIQQKHTIQRSVHLSQKATLTLDYPKVYRTFAAVGDRLKDDRERTELVHFNAPVITSHSTKRDDLCVSNIRNAAQDQPHMTFSKKVPHRLILFDILIGLVKHVVAAVVVNFHLDWHTIFHCSRGSRRIFSSPPLLLPRIAHMIYWADANTVNTAGR
mmetsp:Transcript_34300/g.86264  ORF Transcript_34300/g.86264 Transcript_34300/m.86264 type:complete len:232 (-) Transcript_34300:4397-5092(-)